MSTASDEELQRLAQTISAKVEEIGLHDAGGGGARPESKLSQAVLLAALALAHELEEERARRRAVEERARDILQRVLGQIDEAIDCTAEQ